MVPCGVVGQATFRHDYTHDPILVPETSELAGRVTTWHSGVVVNDTRARVMENPSLGSPSDLHGAEQRSPIGAGEGRQSDITYLKVPPSAPVCATRVCLPLQT